MSRHSALLDPPADMLMAGVGSSLQWARLGHVARAWIVLVLAGALTRIWPWMARRCGVPLEAPERLRRAFEGLGGSFVKLGQLLATQPDLLPASYGRRLFDLLDHMPPVAWSEIQKVLEADLAPDVRMSLTALDPTPLATASIGQVHVGRVARRRVAVKVRRPGVERQFRGDVVWLRLVQRLIQKLRIGRLVPLADTIGEIVHWTTEELDFRNEARTMRSMARHIETVDPAERSVIPEVLHATQRVLIMEFIDGPTALDYLRQADTPDTVVSRRLDHLGFVPERFARRLIDDFLGQVFVDGLFHADPHPGNLVILDESKVGYLDFGITGVLSPYFRRQLVALTFAYTRGDLDGFTGAYTRLAPRNDPAVVEAFRDGLRRLEASWYERRADGLHLRKPIAGVMADVLTLARDTGHWAHRDVVRYIRSAIAIDGLVRMLAPGLDTGRLLEEACARRLAAAPGRSAMAGASIVPGLGSWVASGRRLIESVGALSREGFTLRARPNAVGRSPLRAAGEREWGMLFLVAAMIALTSSGGALPLSSSELLIAWSAWIGFEVITRTGTGGERPAPEASSLR